MYRYLNPHKHHWHDSVSDKASRPLLFTLWEQQVLTSEGFTTPCLERMSRDGAEDIRVGDVLLQASIAVQRC